MITRWYKKRLSCARRKYKRVRVVNRMSLCLSVIDLQRERERSQKEKEKFA